MDINELSYTMSSAKRATRPPRTALHSLYGKAVKDGTLATQMPLAHHLLQPAPSLLYTADEQEDTEATELFKKGGFISFRYLPFRPNFGIHSLVRILLDQDEDNKRALRVSLITREHIKPELGLIVKHPMNAEGLPYRDMP